MRVVRIYLIRHGQTDWNARGLIQGQTDVSLSPAGMRQAQSLARQMGSVRLHAVVSSPLARARETARPIAGLQGQDVRYDPRLMERAWGTYEGLTREDAARRHPDEDDRLRRDPLDAEPPGGESLRAVAERMRDALADAAALGRSVAVVSHGGALAAAMHGLLGTPLGGPVRYHFDNASVTLVEIRNGVIVHFHNRVIRLA